jgi:hypothetical protein
MQSSRWCIGYDRAANDAWPRWINARRPADRCVPCLMLIKVAAMQIMKFCAQQD